MPPESSPPSAASSSPNPEAGRLVRQSSPLGTQESSETNPFHLDRLDREEFIPSVQSWVRHSSTALLAAAGFTLAFVSVVPYRVVVRGTGAVRPAGELVLINAPFEGRVLSIDVKSNQVIQAGQAIVRLDPSEGQSQTRQFQQSQLALGSQAQAQRSEAVAELAAAELEVDKQRSGQQLAESEFRRYGGLAGSGAVPQLVLDEKLANYNQARASLAQASKRLDEIRSRARSTGAVLQREQASINAGLGEARRRLFNSTVRAPVAGVVFKVEVRNPLQTVSAGQLLASVAPSQAEVVVKVAVRGEDVDNVELGQKADVRLQGCPYPDFGTLTAKVVAISPDALPAAEAEAASNYYEVTLKPDKLALKAASRRCEVRIGMGLIADITTRQEPLLRFVLRKTRILVGS